MGYFRVKASVMVPITCEYIVTAQTYTEAIEKALPLDVDTWKSPLWLNGDWNEGNVAWEKAEKLNIDDVTELTT